MGKIKKKPQYTDKAKKCKVCLFDGEHIIAGDAIYTAVKSDENAKHAVITVTLVKEI